MTPFSFSDLIVGYPFGKPVSHALSLEAILEEVGDIADFSTHTMPTLLFTGDYPRSDSNVVANTRIVTDRFSAIATQLHQYVASDHFPIPESMGRFEDDLLDFRAFIGLAMIAVEYYGASSYRAMSHLMAAVLVRYKIERILCMQEREEEESATVHCKDAAKCIGEHDLVPIIPEHEQHLSVYEIALAAGMKPVSVNNAASGKSPVLFKDNSGKVPALEAIQWISRKQGFNWSVTCILIDDNLFLSGTLANAWLKHYTTFECYYSDPQEIVTSWHVPNSNVYFMVNANGRRACYLTLPFNPYIALKKTRPPRARRF